jgi:hypothetical protein
MEDNGFSTIDVEIRHLAEADGVVFTERFDTLIRPDGSRVAPVPVVGRDGVPLRNYQRVARVLRQRDHGAR